MSEKRRDNKNRILRTGESQRKDGRYAYKYIDTFGKPQFVYSWKLVPTDKTPAGKRDDIALREKEKEIQKDLDDGIDHIGKKMTVCQLYAKQIRHRANVRHGTKQGRKQLMRILQEDKLGACRIENVKLSDAFFRLPGLVLLPLRREAGAVASNAFGCADYGSGRRKTPGQAELPGRCGIIPHGCRIIPQIFVYI